MIFSPTGGLNLGCIFVYHNRLSVKVFPSLFRQNCMGFVRSFHHHAAPDYRSTSRTISRSSIGGRTGGICCMISDDTHCGCMLPAFDRWTPNLRAQVVSVKTFLLGPQHHAIAALDPQSAMVTANFPRDPAAPGLSCRRVGQRPSARSPAI